MKPEEYEKEKMQTWRAAFVAACQNPNVTFYDQAIAWANGALASFEKRFTSDSGGEQ